MNSPLTDPASPGRRRLFYALWPDAAVAQKLERLQEGLGDKKTHRNDFHLTLAFLGEQPAESLPVLEAVLRGLPSPEMDLVLNRYGCFKHLNLVWAGMNAVPQALFDLHEGLITALRKSGIVLKQEAVFRPHITLARKVKTMPEANFSPIVWRASSLVLAQSENVPGGGRYRILVRR